MKAFEYSQPATIAEAVRAVGNDARATFLAGGTTLVDLMKLEVLTPASLVHTGQLDLSAIDVTEDVVRVGANVSNSALAWHPDVRNRYPVLSEAILSGATTQLRNMATVAGNLMQRTRCSYFRDRHAACNRRQPGAGCDALDGFNRGHAVLGTSEHCIATHPSDMCIALAILDAEIHTLKPDGAVRALPFAGFHRLPGDTPHIEVALDHGELITRIELPRLPMARRSRYLKVRDRASYEFALASAAVCLDLEGQNIREARLAIGGVATIPWRCTDAERYLVGQRATEETFREAAERALAGAVGRKHNTFKIELAKRTIVRAFSELLEATA